MHSFLTTIPTHSARHSLLVDIATQRLDAGHVGNFYRLRADLLPEVLSPSGSSKARTPPPGGCPGIQVRRKNLQISKLVIMACYNTGICPYEPFISRLTDWTTDSQTVIQILDLSCYRFTLQDEVAASRAEAIMHRSSMQALRGLLLQPSSSSPTRMLLKGPRGSGKSVALASLVEWARATGW